MPTSWGNKYVTDSPEVINAKNVSVAYGSRTIWKDASFSISGGQFVGILGPNGAGKTTLFKLLLGLIAPTSGQIDLFKNKPKRGNPRIGYVPQRRLIDQETTLEVLEFVRLGIKGDKWGFSGPKNVSLERAQAMEALKLVEAESLSARPLGILSGGELQRVFLAQAIVGKPDVLLLDEPLSNLDIRREVNLVQLVSKIIKEQNVTALLIAHDINPLLNVLDSVIYIANGRVATGTPNEIVTSASLSRLYGTAVEVLRDSKGRIAVLGAEEASHPHV